MDSRLHWMINFWAIPPTLNGLCFCILWSFFLSVTIISVHFAWPQISNPGSNVQSDFKQHLVQYACLRNTREMLLILFVSGGSCTNLFSVWSRFVKERFCIRCRHFKDFHKNLSCLIYSSRPHILVLENWQLIPIWRYFHIKASLTHSRNRLKPDNVLGGK